MRNEFTGEATRFGKEFCDHLVVFGSGKKLRDRGKIGGENSEDEKKKGEEEGESKEGRMSKEEERRGRSC